MRARITTASPAGQDFLEADLPPQQAGPDQNYKQRQFAVAGHSVNYKVAIPGRLRARLKPVLSTS